MKINDFIYRFPTASSGRKDGICRVRTFIGVNTQVFVLLTDLGSKNTFSSVTNSIELLHKSLLERGLISNQFSLIEHYEGSDILGDRFAVVTFDNKGSPSWYQSSRVDVEILLQCDQDEFNSKTLNQIRLLNQVDRIRNEIDPFVDSPWPEDPVITKRRNDIESKMISKVELTRLVELGSGEQALQGLLKMDLSIFAEIYAHPKEEYICFSEFPVSDGLVDFAVFSGRSRMDVTLIEIKGADFNLLNKGHYQKFASKIDEATDQIRRRLRHVIDDIKEFRKHAHQTRQNVESGKTVYNSLLGPMGHLEVDPNKDIILRSVVIGGRTVNDHEESMKRHDVERSTHPPIKIESWDTWLRKVSRN